MKSALDLSAKSHNLTKLMAILERQRIVEKHQFCIQEKISSDFPDSINEAKSLEGEQGDIMKKRGSNTSYTENFK